MVGKTISHYKILEKIGQGGMGEVYRAEDTSLKRDVAIKVLPEQFTKDPQRLARFEREAQLLASLNHPNIAAIHSFEHSDDIHFLVLELVEGDTLAERVKKGPLRVEEALEVCRQIAEGVEAAHEKGVIHRDLKPANVKITPEGKVKILDFGLAKAFEGETPVNDISQSPTLTEDMTRAGVILGTAAYMSPEQAKGKPVDKRADIWSFACVLYELLTGKQAFEGETVSDIIAKILRGGPEWAALPGTTPLKIRDLLLRCLQREPHRRLRDIGDARIDIEEALVAPTTEIPTTLQQTGRWRYAVILGVVVVVTAAIASLTTWYLNPGSSSPPLVSRFEVSLPENELLPAVSCPTLAISSDGKLLAYVTVLGGRQRLHLRAMDSLETRLIPGIERRVNSPFFSTDGRWLGFWADGELKRVPTSGGSSVSLSTVDVCGASWGPGDTIVLGLENGLSRISSAGGIPQNLTNSDSEEGKGEQLLPEFLPGGMVVLFTAKASDHSYDDAQIVAHRLDTGARRVLIQGGSHAQYAPTGHLVYARAGTLLAVPFDLAQLEVTGTPVPVVEGVKRTQEGFSQFFVSPTGSLAYVPGGIQQEFMRELIWVDRSGKAQPLAAPRRAYLLPRISPDGRRLAFEIEYGTDHDIWTYDISRQALTRLTFNGDSHWPIWTPDSKRVTFRGSNRDLFWKPADGSSPEERLTTSELDQNPGSWHPEGQLFAYSVEHPSTGLDLWVLPIQGDRKPRPFLQTQFDETFPLFSPDGRWLAYVSDVSGQNEVYVRSFPGPGGRWQISTDGGLEPAWAPNGREMFYRSGNRIMAVDISTEPTFSAARPELLFERQYQTRAGGRANFATADGQRFLIVQPVQQGTEARQINVVLNWFEELKRLVPTN